MKKYYRKKAKKKLKSLTHFSTFILSKQFGSNTQVSGCLTHPKIITRCFKYRGMEKIL